MTPMTPDDYTPGPLAQLRDSSQAPLALAIGAAVGGVAPAVNYVTVHWGHLARFDGTRVHFASWDSPLWLLVAGSFALSIKSVYQWGLNAFAGDRWKAAGLVAMLEGALLVSPHPALGYTALAFLTLINAAHSGSSLAQRDRVDRARESAATTSQPCGETEPAPAQVVEPALPPPRTRPKPAPVRVPALAAPRSGDVPPELYARAVDVARENDSLSTEALRRALSCRQPTAAALIRELEAAGVLGPADPSNRGRRPVLISARSGAGYLADLSPAPHA